MPEVRSLLAKIDAIAYELAELRAELAASAAADNGADDADDLSPENLIDTHAAAARFGFPRDTIAKWCREGSGVKTGGRWLESVPRL